MKKIPILKNFLRAVCFSVIFYLFLLLFNDMAQQMVEQNYVNGKELTKFDILIPIFLFMVFMMGGHFAIQITIKLIPHDKKINSDPELKFKPKLKDWLIVSGVFIVICVYSLIFTLKELTPLQAIIYIFLGMVLISLITVGLKIYYLYQDTLIKNSEE